MVGSLPGALCCVLGQDMELSQCLLLSHFPGLSNPGKCNNKISGLLQTPINLWLAFLVVIVDFN